jgi:uncharacterized protein
MNAISPTPLAAAFAPFEALAERLLAHGLEGGTDGAHDLSHLVRVWRNAWTIWRNEGGDGEILVAAVLLHDCVTVEKNAPNRAQASRLAAEKASGLLFAWDWPPARVAAVAHAIEAHSFSAGIAPATIEAKILQDADRLDAIGMVGVARCFYTGGRMGGFLYDPVDPAARNRAYDDRRFSIDHFHTKLLTLASGFKTARGAELAKQRHGRLERFLDEFMEEVGEGAA